MRKSTLTAASLVILTGCTSNGGTGGGGIQTSADPPGKLIQYEKGVVREPGGVVVYEKETVVTRAPGATADGGEGTPVARTYAGTPYSRDAIEARHRFLPLGERFWPPVYQGQAFPLQEMWTD